MSVSEREMEGVLRRNIVLLTLPHPTFFFFFVFFECHYVKELHTTHVFKKMLGRAAVGGGGWGGGRGGVSGGGVVEERAKVSSGMYKA